MSRDDRFEPVLGYSPQDSLLHRSLGRQLMHRIARAWGNPHRLPGLLAPVPVPIVVPRSGQFNARGRGARVGANRPPSHNWTFDPASGAWARPRRTHVDCRILSASTTKRGSTYSHLRYLERDGVQRNGEPGRLFSTFTDEADRKAFHARSGDDPHQFRLILSPEDDGAYRDLKPFTRDVIARVEADLDTTLDWIAADHFDTAHSHVHAIIRGVTEDGRALRIAGQYLRFGIANHGSDVVTRDLGIKTELEIERQKERAVDAERFTDLDRSLIDRAENGLVDLRAQDLETEFERSLHQELIGRMRWLERMCLATRQEQPMQWQLAPNAGDVLHEMEEHAVRLSAVDRAITDANLTRSPQFYTFHKTLREPVAGSVIACNRRPDRQDRRYLVLDGLDGRTHYVDIGNGAENPSVGSIVRVCPDGTQTHALDRTIAAIASRNGGRYDVAIHLQSDRTATVAVAEAHVRRLEGIHRAGFEIERRSDGSWWIRPDYMDCVRQHETLISGKRPLVIQTLSTLSLWQQVSADGATWLDRQLLGQIQQEHDLYGFGREVQEALLRRQQWLIEQGLVQRDGDHITYRTNLLDELQLREIHHEGQKLGSELQKRFVQASPLERIEGKLRRSLELASGRFALIEGAHEFTLVPWKPEIAHHLGKTVSVVGLGDDYEWSIMRSRGISL
jgi:type IV secretory pathway VirD2 relaxase